MLERLAEVAAENEPVVAMIAERRERSTVRRVADVQIADREQPQLPALRTIVVITSRSTA